MYLNTALQQGNHLKELHIKIKKNVFKELSLSEGVSNMHHKTFVSQTAVGSGLVILTQTYPLYSCTS